MDADSENSVNHSTFPMHHAQQKGMFTSDNGEFTFVSFLVGVLIVEISRAGACDVNVSSLRLIL